MAPSPVLRASGSRAYVERIVLREERNAKFQARTECMYSGKFLISGPATLGCAHFCDAGTGWHGDEGKRVGCYKNPLSIVGREQARRFCRPRGRDLPPA